MLRTWLRRRGAESETVRLDRSVAQVASSREVGRWPNWVYGCGSEPDYRFSFANERTFLAWLRTSLALLAAGVAVDVLPISIPTALQHALAALLVTLGMICAVASWFRWARSERAVRRGAPLPAFGMGALLSLGVLGAAALLALSVV